MAKNSINHFIRGKYLSSDKNLKSEVVIDGSESSQFLKRINLPKKKQPCFHTPDMTNKAPGPYREFIHNNKKMILDDISFQILQKGLKESNNIFTVETYEKIIYGLHTYVGAESTKPESEKTHGLNLIITDDKKRENISDETQKSNIEGSYRPEIQPLGYRAKRKNYRLLYVMAVSLIYKNKRYEAKTKDFSINGLQIFLPRALFIIGDTVSVNFDFFIDEFERLTDSTAQRYFKSIDYQVVDLKHKNDKTYLSLKQKTLKDYAKTYINQFIRKYKGQYKMDAEDIILYARSRYVEHIYSHNLTNIPLYLSQRDDAFYIDHIIESYKNTSLLDFFTYPDSKSHKYDFSPFMLSHRTYQLASFVLLGKSSLFFAYWKDNKLYSICDFEFKHTDEIVFYAYKVIENKGKIFLINGKKVSHPDSKLIEKIAKNILGIDEQDTINDLLEHNSNFVDQLSLTDVSDIFYDHSNLLEHQNKSLASEHGNAIWCEGKFIDTSDNKVIQSVQLNTDNIPHKSMIHVQINRFYPRFLYKIPVIIKVHGQTYDTHTFNFSQTGLGLRIKNNDALKINSHDFVELSFPTFSKKYEHINFYNINYKVVRAFDVDNETELGLVIATDGRNGPIKKFFKELININKIKLSIASQGNIESTYSQVLEEYIKKNINTIPLIISKDKINKQHLKFVALTEIATHLAEHFFLKLRGYNFSLLTSNERINEIYTRTLRNNIEKNQSFTLFIYKDINERGDEFINSFTSYELNLGEKIEMLSILFKNNGACIKLNFVNDMEVSKIELNNIIAMVNSVNRSRAKLFNKQLMEIVGFVDMIDVTLAYRTMYDLQIK